MVGSTSRPVLGSSRPGLSSSSPALMDDSLDPTPSSLIRPSSRAVSREMVLPVWRSIKEPVIMSMSPFCSASSRLSIVSDSGS